MTTYQSTKSTATVEDVHSILETLTYARNQGAELKCIKPTYLTQIDTAIKSLQVRLARGEWTQSNQNEQSVSV
jgi:hypothetical protein